MIWDPAGEPMGTDTFSNTSVAASYWSIDASVLGLGGSAPSVTLQAVGSTTITLTGIVSQPGDTLSVTAPASYGPTPFTATALFAVPGGLVLRDQFGDFLVVSSIALSAGETLDGSASFGQYAGGSGPSPCFAKGTPIATLGGWTLVERLRPGDMAVLATGGFARIAWIGRKLSIVDTNAWPVIFTAGCLRPKIPKEDILLSPDHAVYILGRLVPAHLLVNGSTIRRYATNRVMYYHVELYMHGILSAGGMSVESFLDTGNRDFFDSSVGEDLSKSARDCSAWNDKAFAPKLTSGPMLTQIRATLHKRAVLLGYRLLMKPRITFMISEVPCEKREYSDVISIIVPPNTHEIIFESSSARPCDVFPSNVDNRLLGLAVVEIELNGRILALDDEALFLSGWHRLESTFRWTDGHAVLRIPSLPSQTNLHVKIMPWMRYWSNL